MNRHAMQATTDFNAAFARHRAASPATDAAVAALKAQAHKTAMWLVNDHRHSCLTLPAERIVEDCLRALQAIPAAERFGANDLMDGISFVYLHSSRNEKEFHRRFGAVLRIDAEGEPE